MTQIAAPRLSADDRQAHLDELESREFDVLVVGGGISGAGTAWELSRRGLRVAVVEAEDFASGTSSRSSKLIHGGFRYLFQGHFRLVRNTALERKRLHRLAPHLAEPRWMVVPVHNRAYLTALVTGLGIYERLGRVEPQDRYRRLTGKQIEEFEPGFLSENFPWACAYREYLTDDARLVLANLRSAVKAGAHVTNRLRVDSLIKDGEGMVRGATASCSLTGRTLQIRAKVLVNAAGPWVEDLLNMEGRSARRRLALSLSKGIHLVLPASKLPVRNMVVYQGKDRRRCFAVPRGDVVYLGTTETRFDGPATVWPSITSEDVEYLLSPLARYFSSPIETNDVLGAWAGLRPLVSQPGKSLGEVSRRDEVGIGPGGVVSIAGGKLTGYASMAQKVAARVAQRLRKVLPVAPPDEPLPGGDLSGSIEFLAGQLAGAHGMAQGHAQRMAQLYGSEAHQVLSLGAAPLVDGLAMRQGEVDWAVRVEGAASIEDVLYRRSRSALYDLRARDLVAPIAERMGALLSWDATAVAEQLRQVRARLASDLTFADHRALAPAPGMLTARS